MKFYRDFHEMNVLLIKMLSNFVVAYSLYSHVIKPTINKRNFDNKKLIKLFYSSREA